MTKPTIRIGCDPELFAFDTTTNKPVSVHDLLPGTKHEPYVVPKGAVQVDGVAAEFNIDPAATRGEFLKNISRVSRMLSTIVRAKNENIILKATPTVLFEEKYFEELPFNTKALGCEPDYDAYTGKVNKKPKTDRPMRTGSGHVHIQFVPDGEFVERPGVGDHFARCCELARCLDISLYEPSLMWDTDKERQQLYGKPGAFRPKPYGLEYRVLSNAWLNESFLQMYIFDATLNTTRKWLSGFDLYRRWKDTGKNSFKQLWDFMDNNSIPSIRCYAPEGYIGYEHAVAD